MLIITDWGGTVSGLKQCSCAVSQQELWSKSILADHISICSGVGIFLVRNLEKTSPW